MAAGRAHNAISAIKRLASAKTSKGTANGMDSRSYLSRDLILTPGENAVTAAFFVKRDCKYAGF
jgi:hypothetical protein